MDGHLRKARRARLRLAGLGVLVAGVLVGGGYVAITHLADDNSGGQHALPPATSPASPRPATSPSASQSPLSMTPDKAKPVKLVKPQGQTGGASVGFPRYGVGPLSAAVYHQDELSMLDDDMLRRQLTAITARGSESSIDKAVSDLRTLREALGLPPSGGTPAGLTITTSVDAVRARSLVQDGSVVQVWMHFTRTATLPKAGADDSPLKNQLANVIMIWQDNDWKITTDPAYVAKGSYPLPYDPTSVDSWRDGWWVVTRD